MRAERLFISFSPGFNRVIGGASDFPKPFQRFSPHPKHQKPLKRFEHQGETWVTRLKPGENEMDSLIIQRLWQVTT